MTILKGVGRPFIGNGLDMRKKYGTRAQRRDEPLPVQFTWLVKFLLDRESENGYRPEEHKAVLFNMIGQPVISIHDPDMV